MAQRSTRKEREALIAGDHTTPLSPDQAAELPLLADLLADPSTWAEPRPGGARGRAVVAAVANTKPSTASSITRRTAAPKLRRIAASVAAGVVILTGAMVMTPGRDESRLRGRAGRDCAGPASQWLRRHLAHNHGGFRLTLDAGGLLPLRSDEFYQAWLKDAKRDARADWDVQLERRDHDVVVGCLPGGLPHHHGDDRVLGQRSGLVRQGRPHRQGPLPIVLRIDSALRAHEPTPRRARTRV